MDAREQSHLDLLARGFEDMGQQVSPGIDALALYLDLLGDWSRQASLTGLRRARDRVELGVLDTIPVAGLIGRSLRVVDVGSGNGLPGLVLAILRPDLDVTLLEPVARKAAFLRSAAAETTCRNVTVERRRVEDWEGGPVDVAVSRAVFAPQRWLGIGEPLVVPGGHVLALVPAREIPDPHPTLELERRVAYTLPWSVKDRAVLCYRRTAVA
jgi:16S rRNA (guanine527-N7)-methyltransferase